MNAAPFDHVIADSGALRELYRQPNDFVRSKVRPQLDAASRRFIAASPFVLVATDGPGGCDVSPRGGRPGFVRVLDDGRLAVPDMPGNNLLDTISNVVATGRIGLLFVIPGQDETLRVNGQAWITTDPEVLAGFDPERITPRSAIGVAVEAVYVHCAKAFRRADLWNHDTWPGRSATTDALDILCEQGLLDGDPAALRAEVDAEYAAELAAEHR